MSPQVRPYRWDLVSRVDRRQQRLLAALAHRWPSARASTAAPVALAPLTAAPGPVCAYDGDTLRERLTDPTAFALRLVRADGAIAFAIVPGALGVACAAAVLGIEERERLRAPRALTRAEQGVCCFVAASLLERYALDDVAVEPWHESPRVVPSHLGGVWTLGIDLDVCVAGTRGRVLVVAPEAIAAAPPRRSPLDEWIARSGHRLDGARLLARIVSGSGRVPLRDVLELSPRDVLLLDESPRFDAGRLAVGRGGFPISIDDAGVTLVGEYERGPIMNEAVADDVTVEVTCQLGSVQLSAREVLELTAGQVLQLNRPLGGPVELVVGTRVIGRGELVDVDGELGVRVVALSGA